jgi:hypothetical protein
MPFEVSPVDVAGALRVADEIGSSFE